MQCTAMEYPARFQFPSYTPECVSTYMYCGLTVRYKLVEGNMTRKKSDML